MNLAVIILSMLAGVGLWAIITTFAWPTLYLRFMEGLYPSIMRGLVDYFSTSLASDLRKVNAALPGVVKEAQALGEEVEATREAA